MKKLILLMMAMVLVLSGCQAGKAITQDEAEKIALEKADGKIVSSHMENEDGKVTFEITIVSDTEQVEFEINGKGKITSEERTKINETSTGSKETVIEAEKANQIAIDHVGGGKVIHNKLDSDDGHLVYEIDILKDGTKYELSIDATTGKIVKFEEDH